MGFLLPASISSLDFKRKKKVFVAQSSPTLCDPMDCITCQVPLSTEFCRQEYWNELLCPPPGDLPNPGIEPEFCIAGRFFTMWITTSLKSTFIFRYLKRITSGGVGPLFLDVAEWKKDYKCTISTSLCLLKQCFKRIVSVKYLRCLPHVLISTMPRSKAFSLYLEQN